MQSKTDLELGRSVKQGKMVYLDAKTRSTHMQVIGASGKGKSKFLEHLIRQDILNRQGLCLIDPHGYLYDDLVRWCETKDLFDRGNIVLFDPASDRWTFGFNPFAFQGDEIAFCVDAMVKACAQVWGGEDMSQTPLLKRCLRATFHTLAEQGHTLLEAIELTSPVDSRYLRRYLTSKVEDPIFLEQWEAFNLLRPRDFMEYFSSTNNRLFEFLAAKRIRNIIGQTEKVLNFRSLMDTGAVLLVNLSSGGKLSDDNARLLGTLLVNDLFLKARGRPKGSRPFYLYIDECALFVNEDIGRILDEARKFGLHLILAHQHLAQLKKAGEAVYSAVMTNAQTKVVFGGLTPDDARIMTEAVFMGEFDLEKTKSVFDKPTVVGHIVRYLKSRSETTTRGTSTGTGTASSDTDSRAESEGRSERDEGKGSTRSQATNTGRTTSSSTSDFESETYAEGETEGESESLEPIYDILPTHGYTLEELIYESMAVMINQPRERAIVKIPNRLSVQVRTPEVKDGFANDERVERSKQAAFLHSGFALPTHLAEESIAARRQKLEAEAQEYKSRTEGEAEPKSARE